jgi:acyl carrier protein
MQTKGEIKSFIIENFLYGQDDAMLTEDVSFLDKGIIDSTGVLELVSFVEEKYGVSVGDNDILPENFDSISKLAHFISRKTSNTREALQNV